MAGNAGAVKIGTNDGTITEEVETGLPADGWETFTVGVEIMGTPPIGPGVQDIVSKVEVLARSATLAACTERSRPRSPGTEKRQKTGQPEQKWWIRQHRSIGALEWPQKQMTRQTVAGNC